MYEIEERIAQPWEHVCMLSMTMDLRDGNPEVQFIKKESFAITSKNEI